MPIFACDSCQTLMGMTHMTTHTNPEDGDVLRLCLACAHPEQAPLSLDDRWCDTMRTLMHDWIVAHEGYRTTIPAQTLFTDALDMAAVTLGRRRD